jgi:hypothetical protein
LGAAAAALASRPAAALPQQAYSPALYRSLPLEQRQAYVAGALDAARAFTGFPQVNVLLDQCLPGTTIAQLTVLVDARVSHPQPVDQGVMSQVVYNAIAADCNRRGFKV